MINNENEDKPSEYDQEEAAEKEKLREMIREYLRTNWPHIFASPTRH